MLPGFTEYTNDQLFFIAFGQVLRGKNVQLQANFTITHLAIPQQNYLSMQLRQDLETSQSNKPCMFIYAVVVLLYD